MPSETTDKLRAMALHRGFKLLSSRRRKPGGDFGKYGLNDAEGQPVFGIDKDGLIASAGEIEDYLRGAASNAWSKSAGSTKARPRTKVAKAPAPKSKPRPKPKPRFKVKIENLLTGLPAAKRAEAFTELFARPGVRVERIVSRGQATPENEPMVQTQDEWVLLLEGAAALRIEDSNEVKLGPGDHVWIAAGQQHWVAWTASDRPTVWLAVYLDP